MKSETTSALDRRSAMAALATTGAVAAMPAPAAGAADRAAWDAAMARYMVAKAEMHRLPGDAVVLRFIDAEKAMFETRAPDMQAFRWKVERIRENCEHSVLEKEDFDCLLADLQRLGSA